MFGSGGFTVTPPRQGPTVIGVVTEGSMVSVVYLLSQLSDPVVPGPLRGIFSPRQSIVVVNPVFLGGPSQSKSLWCNLLQFEQGNVLWLRSHVVLRTFPCIHPK